MSISQQYSGTNILNYPYKEKNITTTSTGTSRSTGSSTTTDENCHIMVRASCEKLRLLYEESIGHRMTGAILRQLLLSLIEGTPAEYYQYALEETACAPLPSWRYTMAIVKRLQAQRVPPDRVRESQQKSQQGRRLLAEQDYTQREYVHDESRLDALMDEFLRKEE